MFFRMLKSRFFKKPGRRVGLFRKVFRREGRQNPPKWFMSMMASLMVSMATIIAIWDKGDRLADQYKTMFTMRNGLEEFDFIVVGAGIAGAVVANRLSSNPNWNVLLIEAGGEPLPLQSIPAMAPFIINYPQLDWMHRTVPQKNSCFGLVNNVSSWSQGKSLGGTGNINHLFYFRGNPKDFDNWAEITEDDSWSYDQLLPYFRKIEDFHGQWSNGDIHGKGGPLRVEIPDYTGIAPEYLKAAQEMGYYNVDLNGKYTEGFDTTYYAINRGRRQATFKSYIAPIRRRPNLRIYKFAHVNKILFRENSTEAFGIEYERHGKRQIATARKEIILSAGAVQSPKLLMLSGIGPKAHLKNNNIEVLADLPVGQNLQDHVSTYLGPFEMSSATFQTANYDRDVSPRAFYEFGKFGAGPLTTSGVQASGILVSSIAKQRDETMWPDLQIYLMGVSVHPGFAEAAARAYQLKRSDFIKYYTPAVGKNSFHQIISLGRPRSRGHVTLASRNAVEPVIIDPNYLNHPEDAQVLVEGMKKAIELAERTSTFKKAGTKFTETVLPGCEGLPFKSDSYLECYARTYTVSLHHYGGTCAMGPINSKHSVVDSQLRVIGIKNLRVVDASVMPVLPVSNTQASTLMIGEKASHLIIQTHTEQQQSASTSQTSTTSDTSTSTSTSGTSTVSSTSDTTTSTSTSTSDTSTPTSSPILFPDYDFNDANEANEDIKHRKPSKSPPQLQSILKKVNAKFNSS